VLIEKAPMLRPHRKHAERARRLVMGIALLCVTWAPAEAIAQITLPATKTYFEPPDRPGGIGPKGEFVPRQGFGSAPKTWRAMRDAGVVRQGWDYSCGSAALATLLSTAEEPVGEKEILLEALSGLTEEEQHQTMEAGLTLLDLHKVAEGRGLRAAGYRVGPEFLPTITRPVLVFVQPQGYRHFAVMRGVRGDRVFLADPARGNVRLPIWRFLKMWQDEEGKGVIFLVGASTPETLSLAGDEPTQPELMSVRQLMNVVATPVTRARIR
jgi:predicted double-glycine peptidase